MGKVHKRELVQAKDIVKADSLESIEYPFAAICNSCKQVWAAKSQVVLDRFNFTVPGSWEAFVCPECRHLVGW